MCISCSPLLNSADGDMLPCPRKCWQVPTAKNGTASPPRLVLLLWCVVLGSQRFARRLDRKLSLRSLTARTEPRPEGAVQPITRHITWSELNARASANEACGGRPPDR